jgi:hypothetical protein
MVSYASLSIGWHGRCVLGDFYLVELHAAERQHSSVVLCYDSVLKRENGHM